MKSLSFVAFLVFASNVFAAGSVQKIVDVIRVDLGIGCQNFPAGNCPVDASTSLSDLNYPGGLELFKKYPSVFGKNYAALSKRVDQNCGGGNATIRCITTQLVLP